MDGKGGERKGREGKEGEGRGGNDGQRSFESRNLSKEPNSSL